MTQQAASTFSRGNFSSLKGKVVLIVGAYRCEATVAETIKSILEQGPALECLRHVLLTDDFGGDRTYDVAKALWNHPVPLVLHQCKKNQGEYRNINSIVEELPAEVEWIVILHGDNVAKHGWLEAILGQLVNARPDLATFSTSWDDLKEDGTIVPARPESDYNYREFIGTRETMRDTLVNGCWWHISSCAIRCSAFRSVGGLPANGMRHKGDWYLLTKFLNRGFRVGYIPKSLMLYRRNPEGSSSLSYRATGDVLEALWVISQFNHRLYVGEVLYLHRRLVENVLSRAMKALVVGKFGYLFSLLSRALGIAFSALINCLRVIKTWPAVAALVDPLLGLLDFTRDRKEPKAGLNLPLNGQEFRRKIVDEILSELPPEAIVETGTYRGSTTELFAGLFKGPVESCEVSHRNLAYARLKLAGHSNVHLWRGDSVHFLEKLGGDEKLPKRNVFFYLDAHWENMLPLREELKLIGSTWKNYVLLIDDFRVPGDAGYGYDDYGPGQRLDLSEFEKELEGHYVFFPSLPSAKETGLKRGCVVLTDSAEVAERLGRLPTLHQHGEAAGRKHASR